MDASLGLVLTLLTLYTSTLAYALRTYSRSRLLAMIEPSRRDLWLARLDEHETELQLAASTLRLVCIVALVMFIHLRVPVWPISVSSQVGLLLSAAVNLILLVIFAVGVPHSIATHAGEWVLRRSLSLVWALRWGLTPIDKLLGAVDFVVKRLLGVSETSPEDATERHEQEILDAVTEGELHGAVDEEQKEMIESVIELQDTPVSAIMTPRTDIVALSVDASADQVLSTVVEAGHSRVPVYEGSLDHIIGVLYAKDLLRLSGDRSFDLRALIREVPYVPETKPINALLREMRQQRVHIAIVLDEYGGTAGLVTIEDIIEELVGEIDDEYDRESPPEIKQIDPDTLEVDARVHVHDVNELLEINIPENGDYETIGGYVFTTLGKIPAAGEQLDSDDVSIRVLSAEPRKINRLRISAKRRAATA